MHRLPHLSDRHRAKFAGAALLASMLALTALAGCAEKEPEPKFENAPTTSPSAPPTAAGTEKETVKEFLVRWAEVEAEMQNTGKTAEYLALSPGCEPCEILTDTVREIYKNDGFVRTQAMRIERVERIKKTQRYQVWADLPPSVYRESASAPEKSFAGGPQGYLFFISPSGGSFLVGDYARTPR